MSNQLLQNLQNLLKNKSNKINLITEEFSKSEISADQSNSFENIFLTTAVIFSTILALLTYFNYQKNLEISEKYKNLESIISSTKNAEVPPEEIKSRIQDLEKYKSINQSKVRVGEFYLFLNQIISLLKDERIIDLKFTKTENVFTYTIVLNSEKNLIEQELNSFFQTNLYPNQIEKVREQNLPNTNLKQFEFKGNYEIRK